MQVSVNKVGPCDREVKVALPRQRFDDKVNGRIQELSKTMRLKGFRPGKVPTRLIAQRFGADVRNEVLEGMVRESLGEALEAQQLRVLSQPDVADLPEIGDEEVTFTAKVQVMPELDPIDATKLTIEKPIAAVEDGDIDNMIETLRAQREQWDDVERASAAGDLVSFDFSFKSDAVTFPETGTQSASMVLESEDDASQALLSMLTGLAAGEAKSGEISFDETVAFEPLREQQGEIEIKVVGVKERKLPEVDTDFVKSFDVESGAMDDFRVEVRNNLERELRNATKRKLRQATIKALIADVGEFEVPSSAVSRELLNIYQELQRQTQNQANINLESLQPMAQERTRESILLAEIARQQEISLDQDRLTTEVQSLAETYDDSQAAMNYIMSNEDMLANLSSRVIEEQVVDWVVEQATVTEREQSFDEVVKAQTPIEEAVEVVAEESDA